MATYRINPNVLRYLTRRSNQDFDQLHYRDHDQKVTPYSLYALGDTPTHIESAGLLPAYVDKMLLKSSC